MIHRLLYLLLFLLAGNILYAQTLPAPGAKLNYTQIMFEHEQIKGADGYLIEVDIDEPHSSLFLRPIVSRKDSSTAALISNFEFGKNYVWRYTGLRNGKPISSKGPFSFEILTSPWVDKKLHRVKVIANDSANNAGGLIIMDFARSIIDRTGNYVWFLPQDTSPVPKNDQRRPVDEMIVDLQLSPAGTVTFLNGSRAEETDLDGNVLWQAPKTNIDSSGKPYSNYYNHCFKRLANGNYMLIDKERFRLPFVQQGATEEKETIIDDEVLMEFDKSGHLVWNWSSANYFDTAELAVMINSKPEPGLFNPTPGGHMNSFDVDSKNEFVYAGFRNVSRVIKIDKKTNKVVCSWGEKSLYNSAKNGAGFFTKQHGSALMHDGSIAVFNNGDLHPENGSDGSLIPSSVVIFSQPSATTNSKIIWKYDCRLDSAKNMAWRWGNVNELKNDNLLVGMGAVNRVFEITRSKRIVWSAVIEKRAAIDSPWTAFPVYRANYVSSLYPCYFTIQTSTDTLTEKSNSFKLLVFNDGTDADSYHVNISSARGNYKKELSTGVIKGSKSFQLQVQPNKTPVSNDIIKLTVHSTSSPDFVRTIYVHYKK